MSFTLAAVFGLPDDLQVPIQLKSTNGSWRVGGQIKAPERSTLLDVKRIFEWVRTKVPDVPDELPSSIGGIGIKYLDVTAGLSSKSLGISGGLTDIPLPGRGTVTNAVLAVEYDGTLTFCVDGTFNGRKVHLCVPAQIFVYDNGDPIPFPDQPVGPAPSPGPELIAALTGLAAAGAALAGLLVWMVQSSIEMMNALTELRLAVASLENALQALREAQATLGRAFDAMDLLEGNLRALQSVDLESALVQPLEELLVVAVAE